MSRQPKKKVANKRRIKRQTRKVKRLSRQELIDALKASSSRYELIQKIHYEEFHDLEFQRMLKLERLKKSLMSTAIKKLPLKAWVRCISYKYSATIPLSVKGSVCFIGGRFNMGEDINSEAFKPFHALYLAQDLTTALMEKFGVKKKSRY